MIYWKFNVNSFQASTSPLLTAFQNELRAKSSDINKKDDISWSVFDQNVLFYMNNFCNSTNIWSEFFIPFYVLFLSI